MVVGPGARGAGQHRDSSGPLDRSLEHQHPGLAERGGAPFPAISPSRQRTSSGADTCSDVLHERGGARGEFWVAMYQSGGNCAAGVAPEPGLVAELERLLAAEHSLHQAVEQSIQEMESKLEVGDAPPCCALASL